MHAGEGLDLLSPIPAAVRAASNTTPIIGDWPGQLTTFCNTEHYYHSYELSAISARHVQKFSATCHLGFTCER